MTDERLEELLSILDEGGAWEDDNGNLCNMPSKQLDDALQDAMTLVYEEQQRRIPSEEVQRAIEFMKEWRTELKIMTQGNEAEYEKNQMETIIRVLSQMQGWIPVSEYKGYGIYVPVLRWDKYSGYYEDFAAYDNQIKSWIKQDDTDEPILLDNVTHYFKLPEAPKGD